MHATLLQAIAEKDERGFKVGTKRRWKGGVEVVKTKEGWKEEPSGRQKRLAPAPGLHSATGPGNGLAGRLKSAIGNASEIGTGAAERAREGAKAAFTHHVAPRAKAATVAAKRAPEVAKKVAPSIAAKIKGLPQAAVKLVTDRDYRGRIGRQMGEALKRKALSAKKALVGELRELKDAGDAMKRLALRQPLHPHHHHALKQAAKAIASTIAGTIVIGGLGHVTVAALSTHFVAETLAKHVGKAALFADVQRSGWPIYESADAAIAEVVERVTAKVVEQLNGLGSMSDEQVADIIAAYRKENGDGDEGDGDSDESPGQSTAPEKDAKEEPGDDGGIKLKGERPWKPGAHNRKVDTSRWG